jgi:RNA polymerase sigma-70 factor (ECF subfamily)
LNARRRRKWSPLDDVAHVPASPLATRSQPADLDLANHIRRAFVALPPKLRVVATLALIEELPLAEVADALEIPLGTVKSRLFRATRELRTELTRLGIQT